jgi:Tol biopolymer transport system component
LKQRFSRTTSAAVAVVGVLCDSPPPQAAFTLLTIPQRDGLRSRSGEPTASVSADGRYIAFVSYAALASKDVDRFADVYVLDRVTGAVTLESESADGQPLIGDCGHPRISDAGRYLVFEGTLDGHGQAGHVSDILLRDRGSGATRVISRGARGEPADGWSSSAAISDDGRAVAFASTATNLVPGPDANGSRSDIYLFLAGTNVTQRVSVDSRGLQYGGGSVKPTISADGRYVAFSSLLAQTSLAGGQPREAPLAMHLRDTATGQTTELKPQGPVPNGASMNPVISGNGKYVAFASRATNLVTGDRNRSLDVFLYEIATGAITAVSRGVNGGTANGASINPAISADGRFVLFQSDASDLACTRCAPGTEDINLLPDVFVFDRTTGRVTCLSVGADGAWMEESGAPAVDASGRVIAFTSRHPISTEDTSNDFDLFVWIGETREG